jgi:tetratricopeptide (TPR) repeat protein
MGEAQEWVRAGIARFAAGDARGALALFERAVAAEPASADARNGRGNVRLALGDAAGALEDYTQAIALAPGEAKAWGNRAQARLVARDWAGARADADAALARRRHDPNGYHTRAFAHLAQGRLADARGDFERFVALSPSDRRCREVARVLKWIADRERALSLRTEARTRLARHDAAGALAALARATALAGEDAEGAELAASAHVMGGDLAAAREAYGRAIAMDRERADAWFGRAACAHAAMDLPAARRDYEMFVALAGTDPRVPRVKSLLEGLKQPA